ncbi:flavin reductase family protein [Psychrobacter sp. 72-O-c]|uniref:flavin reductase family protein n=1 Tax=Psychrobacter sp. 72-O-c TaxID=2774125 RepID=UPI001918B975|nr:iron-sulfur cluster-binding domain-containing protein [Psychrobacter sp. 72-O-c]
MPSGYQPEIVQHAFIGFMGSRLHPFWSLTVPKLRLIARRALSDDLIALQFETNRAFRKQAFGSKNSLHDGWYGGQHIDLNVVIDGTYHQRSYSLIGLPQQPLWWHDDVTSDKTSKNKKTQRHTVTIAIKPQGLVSDYLTQHAALGSIFGSSMPIGDFTLEQTVLKKQVSSSTKKSSIDESPINELFAEESNINNLSPLLFIAGGSGITPMLGLITQALQYGHQVTLLYYDRTALIKGPLQGNWQRLADKYPMFTYHLVNTEDRSTYLADSRHLSTESLLALSLPLADTQIFACGSQELLAGLYRATAEITLPQGSSLRDNIIVENFGHALPSFNNDKTEQNTTGSIEEKTVYLRGRQRQFTSDTTLLLSAEDAGIRLAYGCRQGICQLCRCNKVSGVVKNIQTGKLSSDGYESIQTCINMPVTDVVLDI